MALLSFFWLTYYCSIGLCFSVRVQLSLFRSTCKLIQSFFLQWFVKLMGPSLFSFIILIVFFFSLIKTCRLWVIYVREDNYSNVKVMIKWLIWTIWTLMSSVLKKADKLNLSLSLSRSLYIYKNSNIPQLWQHWQHICNVKGMPSNYFMLVTSVPFHWHGLTLISAGVGGAVRFLVVGTIGEEERPPWGQLWMEQCLTSLKYWPI